MDLRNIALNLIERNSGKIQNTPWKQQAIECIRNNDSRAGEALAMNLCSSYGIDQNEVKRQAQEIIQNDPDLGFLANLF